MKFRDEFSEKDTIEVPFKWIEHINELAPEGTHYVPIDEHRFQLLSTEDDSFQFKFEEQILPDWFPKISNYEEFLAVFNNAQRPIEVKNPSYYIKDQEIDSDATPKDFSGQVETSKEGVKHFISPITFSEAVEFKIIANSNSYKYHLKRVPLVSIHERKFETVDDKIIRLSFVINEKTNKINFRLEIDFRKAESILEIINNKEEISDFINGPHIIFGDKININSEDIKDSLNRILDFYASLYEVFTKSKISNTNGDIIEINDFEINDITIEEIEDVRKFYISFVEEKIYYNDNEHKDLIIHYDPDKSEEILGVTKEGKFAVSGFKELTFNILNVEFNLFEKFTFKEVKFNKIVDNEKELLKINYEVLNDRIQYRKFFREIPTEEKMNINIEEIEEAIKIESL